MKHSSTHPFSGDDSISLNYNPAQDEFKDIEDFSAIFNSLDDVFEADDSLIEKVVNFAKSYPHSGN